LSESFESLELSDPDQERDGLRVATVKSRYLRRRSDVSIWIPGAESIGTLLILLHGVYGSHWIWSMKGGVHRTAQRMLESHEIDPMVIAMPNDGLAADGSGYLMRPGVEDVERWILDEVPAIARIAAPNLMRCANIAIAGLSMGGYAALRLGSKYPERFSSISAHSAFERIEQISAFTKEPIETYLRTAPHEELSASHLLSKNRNRLPSIRFDCGLDDDLLETNRGLHASLCEQGIANEYGEFPGSHDWPYWRTHVADTLRHADRHSKRKVTHETN
jgi:putative tributyrin esterase